MGNFPTRGDECVQKTQKTSSRDFQGCTGYGDILCHIRVSTGPKSRLAGTMGKTFCTELKDEALTSSCVERHLWVSPVCLRSRHLITKMSHIVPRRQVVVFKAESVIRLL